MNGGIAMLASDASNLVLMKKRRCAFTYNGERYIGFLIGKSVASLSDIWQDDTRGPVLIPWSTESCHIDKLLTNFEIDVPLPAKP